MICVHLAWSIYIVVYYGMLLNIRSFSREHLEVNTVVAGKCTVERQTIDGWIDGLVYDFHRF